MSQDDFTLRNGVNAGAPGKLVKGSIAAANLTWRECNGTVTTLAGGTLEVSLVSGTGSASLKSTGAEVTAEVSLGPAVLRTPWT